MRSKRFFILIVFVFLVVSSIFIVQFFNSSEPNPTNEAQLESVTKEEEPETEKIEDVIEEAQAEEERKDPITEEIRKKVKHVVDSALGLFLKPDLRIVAIGDSLTQGVGDLTDNGGYVGILQNTFQDSDQDIRIDNYGKKGNRSDQLLKRLEDEEIQHSIEAADIVLITIGANDIMKVVQNNFMNLEYEPFVKEQENYSTRLTQIFNNIIELNPDASIYLVGFYNPFEKYFSDIEQLGLILDNWNSAGESITGEYDQVSFIPTEDLFSDTEEVLLSDDHFHPNVAGYKLIAERVMDYIKPSIERVEDHPLTEELHEGPIREEMHDMPETEEIQ